MTSPPMAETSELSALRAKLATLRVEFIDLAFALERRGRIDAADVAMTASARVAELCEDGEPLAHSPADEAV